MKSELFSNVLENVKVAEKTYKIKLKIPKSLDFIPGQFANIKINRPDLLLRRPISFHNYHDNVMTLIYKVVGKGTNELSLVKTGDILSILAPLGNGFSILPEYKNIWLVGGGIGCAPFMSVISHNPSIKFDCYFGFDTKESIYCLDEYKKVGNEVLISTDNGSMGYHGFITELIQQQLNNTKPDAIFACGPTPMLKSLKAVLENHPIKTFISIEERMGCGMGGCAVCACKTVDGVKKACVDGPVFDMDKVVL